MILSENRFSFRDAPSLAALALDHAGRLRHNLAIIERDEEKMVGRGKERLSPN